MGIKILWNDAEYNEMKANLDTAVDKAVIMEKKRLCEAEGELKKMILVFKKPCKKDTHWFEVRHEQSEVSTGTFSFSYEGVFVCKKCGASLKVESGFGDEINAVLANPLAKKPVKH